MSNEIQFLLDCSGSMGSVRQEAVEGFDGFVQRVKDARIKAEIEVVFFDTHQDTVYKGDVALIASIAKSYGIKGGTALWDTIGQAINHKLPSAPVGNAALNDARLGRGAYSRSPVLCGGGMRSFGGAQTNEEKLLARLGVDPSKVSQPPAAWRPPVPETPGLRQLCVVGTDGEDCDSHLYDEDDIKKLILQREAEGNFTFIWIAIGRHATKPAWVHEGNLLAFDDPKRLKAALDKLAAATVHFLSSGADATETFFLTEGKS